jgi:metal-responsive CopG/Arc/MetJ family transcriptional regulator
MRTTVNLDDALLKRAQRLSGFSERSVLLREALNALIQRESARRLSLLGGSEKQLRKIDRRRAAVK